MRNKLMGGQCRAFLWKKPGLHRICPYKGPPCQAILLTEDDLCKQEFNFKGDHISSQAAICHACELDTPLHPLTLKIFPSVF